jgi:DNA-binding FadR family transcriptional regulator
MAAARPLSRVERRPLRELLQEAIKSYIVGNRLKPGDPLPPEAELAEQLGVGRNSVREAVRSLEVLGILESRAGTGLFVRAFSFDPIVANLSYGVLFDTKALADSLDVRLVLESSLVERAIEARNEAQLAHLRQILESWGQAARTYSPEYDRAFHRALHENEENALLTRLIDVFWDVYRQATAHGAIQDPSDPEETYQRHVAILEALEAGDPAGLRQAIADHTPGIKRRVEAARAHVGSEFPGSDAATADNAGKAD